MKTNPPGVEFVINILKFDKLNKRESCRRFLLCRCEGEIWQFHVVEVQCQQRNAPKRVLHLAKLLFCYSKPIAFLTFSLSSASSTS